MEVRRELVVAIGTLIALSVSIAFGTIGVLTRMTPAIGEILADNAYSNEAAEQMLAQLAGASGPVSPAGRRDFRDALARARRNVTEGPEPAVLEAIQRRSQAALGGDAEARRALTESLMALVQINRAAMRAADEEAQRLGEAGAWVAALLGLIASLVGAGALRRVQRRVIDPIDEIDQVCGAYRKGEVYRRCKRTDAPAEIARIMETLDDLLDEHMARGASLRLGVATSTGESDAQAQRQAQTSGSQL